MTGIRVLALIDTFRVGGPGKQLIAFCKAAPGYGLTVRLAAFLRRPLKTSPFIEACRAEGLPVWIFEERFPFDPRLPSLVRSDMLKNRIDLLQTHSYKANVVGALLSSRMRQAGMRWCGYLHGTTNENLKIRLYYALELWAVRHADGIVPVSEAIGRVVAARLGRSRSHLEVIPNAWLPEAAPDPRTRQQARRDLGASDDAIVIGAVGRLSREKGQGVLIEALTRLNDRAVMALLIGEGPDEQGLKQQVAVLGLNGRVCFLGYRNDMTAIYAGMDLAVIPSLSEGIPNVALEAMGRGIPLIATAVGGIPEMVTDRKSGLLVPPGDADALARAIRFMIDHPEERSKIGEAGRAAAAARYSLAERMKRVKALYERLMAPPVLHG
ncbi:MAG: glycosyltransferase [Nitrospirae bacterium]|nr:glycosyltransferase [Nitrospirota bacterium]